LGRSTLRNERIDAKFDGGRYLPELCLKLLSDQKKVWQDLREGCESLKNVRERDLSCKGFSVRLQHNPGRIKSSLADVSERNANERPCFLCLNQLPEGQKGILYRREYLILCNPMPVFPAHFTVSHIDHRIQTIAGPIETLLQLMADFGSGWMVLYNGPQCGASAPGHLHFQTGPSGQVPIEQETQEKNRRTLMTQVEGVLLYRVRDLGREVIILEASNLTTMGSVFTRFLTAVKKVLLLDEEPMVNIAGFYEKRRLRLVIFPRRKHRPDAFFKEGDDRVVVSPGVIDMGGLVITPVGKDFERLDAPAVEGIYREVSLEGKIVERAIDAMR
jgi:hypothetical protein